MQDTFKVRKFNTNDLQAVININRVALPVNYTDYFFVDLYRRFPDTFIVAEADGELAGYIMCRIEVGMSNFGFGGLMKKGHIVSVAVIPQHRRKGIAQAVIKRAIEGMLGYGAKQCYLEVRVTNTAAIDLYKKLGFEITRTVHGYYADGEDGYVMSRKI